MIRLKYFQNLDEMRDHALELRLFLVAYKGIVYDVTDFLAQHPGGSDVLKPFKNKSIDDVLFNKEYHVHSMDVIWRLQEKIYGHINKNTSLSPRNKLSSNRVNSTRKILFNTEKCLKKMKESQTTDIGEDDIPVQRIPRLNYKPGISDVSQFSKSQPTSQIYI